MEMARPGTPEIESDDAVPSKAKEPVIFYGLPKRAGDRGRTGDGGWLRK